MAVDPREDGQVIIRSSIDYAKAAEFWAFKKPVAYRAGCETRSMVKTEIDRFVLAKLEPI